jgi:hypothetical protein
LLTTAASILLVAAASAWRWFDGTSGHLFGRHVRTTYRNLVTGALAGSAAVLGIDQFWWALWTATIAALSVISGYTKWESFVWQAIRFGGPACVAIAPLRYLGLTDDLSAAAYILASMIGGVSYTLLREDRARLVLGATVVGGLVIL